jgi:hypothetical protein
MIRLSTLLRGIGANRLGRPEEDAPVLPPRRVSGTFVIWKRGLAPGPRGTEERMRMVDDPRGPAVSRDL